MDSAKLTTRLTVLRPGAPVDDGLQAVTGAPVPLSQRPWAMRRDVSDGEVVRAGMILGSRISRFTLKRTAFSGDIRVMDLLQVGAVTYDISGIKEIADRDIEITAVARVDRGA